MSKLPIGTFINMATIIIGSLIGLLFQQIFPENIRDITFLAVGLGVLVIGLQMSLKVPDEYLPIFIISLVLGGILGELIGVEDFLDDCELWMRANFKFGGVGGLLIVAVSVKMLELGNFRVANLLPSLLVVVLLTWLQRKFKFKF